MMPDLVWSGAMGHEATVRAGTVCAETVRAETAPGAAARKALLPGQTAGEETRGEESGREKTGCEDSGHEETGREVIASRATARGTAHRATAPCVTATAPAKINLALRVGRRRADGYHPLNTLFHSVDLVERVTVGPVTAAVGGVSEVHGPASGKDANWTGGTGGDQLSVIGLHTPAVPLGQSNLVLRAAALLRREHGPQPAVRLCIDKSIPVAGGLAGGSADAAAALISLNTWWTLGLDRAQLVSLAAELGSDVPFAVLGGNAIGSGRGEDLQPVDSSGPLHWVLMTSPEGLSTPEVFARFDALGGAAALTEAPPIPPALLEGLACGDPGLVGANLVNDLQPVAITMRPNLGLLMDAALNAGACGAIVSGSGPTVACLAASASHAVDLATAMKSWLVQNGAVASVALAADRIIVATGPINPKSPQVGTCCQESGSPKGARQ